MVKNNAIERLIRPNENCFIKDNGGYTNTALLLRIELKKKGVSFPGDMWDIIQLKKLLKESGK